MTKTQIKCYFIYHLTGSTFKKVYFDPTKQRAVSKFVPAEDLIVPYSASDIRTSRKSDTHGANELHMMTFVNYKSLGYIKMWSYLLQILEKMKDLSKKQLMSFKDYIQIIQMIVTPYLKSMWTWTWKVLKIWIWQGLPYICPLYCYP